MNTKTFLGNAVLQNFVLGQLRSGRFLAYRSETPEPRTESLNENKEAKEDLKKLRVTVQKDLDMKEHARAYPFAGLDEKSMASIRSYCKGNAMNEADLWVAIINKKDARVDREELAFLLRKSEKEVTEDDVAALRTVLKQEGVRRYFAVLKDIGKPSFENAKGKRVESKTALFPKMKEDGTYENPSAPYIIPAIIDARGVVFRNVAVDGQGWVDLPGVEKANQPSVTEETWNVTLEGKRYVIDVVDKVVPVLRAEGADSKGKAGEAYAGNELGVSFEEISEFVKFALPKDVESRLRKEGLTKAQTKAVLAKFIKDQGADKILAGRDVKKGRGNFIKSIFSKGEVFMVDFSESQVANYAAWAKGSRAGALNEKAGAIDGADREAFRKNEEKLATVLSELFDLDNDNVLKMVRGSSGKFAGEVADRRERVASFSRGESNAVNRLTLLVDRYRQVAHETADPAQALQAVVAQLNEMVALGKPAAVAQLEASRSKKNSSEVDARIAATEAIAANAKAGNFTTLESFARPAKGGLQDVKELLVAGATRAERISGSMGAFLDDKSNALWEARDAQEEALEADARKTAEQVVNELAAKMEITPKDTERYRKLQEAVYDLHIGAFGGRAIRERRHDVYRGNTLERSTVTKTVTPLGGAGLRKEFDLGGGWKIYAEGGAGKTGLLSGFSIGAGAGIEYVVTKGKTTYEVRVGTGSAGGRVEVRLGKASVGAEAMTTWGGAYAHFLGRVNWDNPQEKLEKNVQKIFNVQGIDQMVAGLKGAKDWTEAHAAIQTLKAQAGKTGELASALAEPLDAIDTSTEEGKRRYVEAFTASLGDLMGEVRAVAAMSPEWQKKKLAGIQAGVAFLGGFPMPVIGVIIRKGVNRMREYGYPTSRDAAAIEQALMARANAKIGEAGYEQATEGKWNIDERGVATQRVNEALTDYEGKTLWDITTDICDIPASALKGMPDPAQVDAADPLNDKNVNRVAAALRTPGIALEARGGHYYMEFKGISLPNLEGFKTRYEVYAEEGVGTAADIDGVLAGKGLHSIRAVTTYNNGTALTRMYLSAGPHWTPAPDTKPSLVRAMDERRNPGTGKFEYRVTKHEGAMLKSEVPAALERPERIVTEQQVLDAVNLTADEKAKGRTEKAKEITADQKKAIDEKVAEVAKKMEKIGSKERKAYEDVIQQAVLPDQPGRSEYNFLDALRTVFGKDSVSVDDENFTLMVAGNKLESSNPRIVSYLRQKLDDLYFYDRPGKKVREEAKDRLQKQVDRLRKEAAEQVSKRFGISTETAAKLYERVYGKEKNLPVEKFFKGKDYLDPEGSVTGRVWSLYAHGMVDKGEKGILAFNALQESGMGLFNAQEIKDFAKDDTDMSAKEKAAVRLAMLKELEAKDGYVTSIVKSYEPLLTKYGMWNEGNRATIATAFMEGGEAKFAGELEIAGREGEKVKAPISVTVSPDESQAVLLGAYEDCTNFSMGVRGGLKVAMKLEGTYVLPGQIRSAYAADALRYTEGMPIMQGKYMTVNGGWLICRDHTYTYARITPRPGGPIIKP